MKQAITIGLDLAKNVFQVHAIDGSGEGVLRRKRRSTEVDSFFRSQPPLTVGIKACGGAHHWARVLENLGHRVRLMPPAYVKPYVKRGKTDAADAEAICEAVTRPTMRFVPAKTEAQQAAGVELKVRQTLVRQMTRTVNALRGHLAEFEIVAANDEIEKPASQVRVDRVRQSAEERVTLIRHPHRETHRGPRPIGRTRGRTHDRTSLLGRSVAGNP